MSRPEFNHAIIGKIHTAGDALCTPFSFAMGHLMKVIDPIKEGRAQDMGQASNPAVEIARRVVVAPFLLALLVPSALLAGVGQVIKVPCNFDKKLFVHVKPGSSGAREPHHFKTDEEHRLISWNLAAMPAVMRRHNYTRPVSNRMHEVVDYVQRHNPEVVALQECFTDEAVDILEKGLGKEWPHSLHHVGQNIIGLNSGLMIMSKYPIIGEPIFECFEGKSGTNALSQKGCLGVILDLGEGKRAVVVNIHLEAGGSGRAEVGPEELPEAFREKGKLTKKQKKLLTSAKFNKSKQLEQAEALKQRLINQVSKDHEVVFSVIMGDTNIGHNLDDWDDPILKNAKERITSVCSRALTPLTPTSGASVLNDKDRILPGSELTRAQAHAKPKRDRVDWTEMDQDSHVDPDTFDQSIGYDGGDASDHFPFSTTFRYKMK